MLNETTNQTFPAPVLFKNLFHRKSRTPMSSGKKRVWRSLKQVLTQEKILSWTSKTICCKLI